MNATKQCHFCAHKVVTLDYKDAYLLRRFMNSQGKIYPQKRHGTCARHQRELTRAIKRARSLALVPYIAL